MEMILRGLLEKVTVSGLRSADCVVLEEVSAV